MRSHEQPEFQAIWTETAHAFTESDHIMENKSLNESLNELQSTQQNKIKGHLHALILQGSIFNSLDGVIQTKFMREWSDTVNSLPQFLFEFTRKAILQVLPTNANLHRWKRSDNPFCPLCNTSKKQTLKHVLSNCSAVSSLSRYTSRHNSILEILASYFLSVLSGEYTLFVDLESTKFRQVAEIFQTTIRPDLAIIYDKSIFVLELTICHESNFSKS